MSLLKTLDRWSENHDSIWTDVLRMTLGIILIIKGFLFLINISILQNDLQMYFSTTNATAALVIAGIHLLAGFLILIGLATRFACLVQIPILFGAIVFVNFHNSAAELISSLLVFFLLLFFAARGSGKFSAYFYIVNSRRGRLVTRSNAPAANAPLTAIMDKEGNLR